HWCRRSERGPDREPRHDYRCRTRRHQSLRRPRRDTRLAGWSRGGRCPAQRPHADGRFVGVPGARDRDPRDPRRKRRPTLAQVSALTGGVMSTVPLVMEAKGLVKRFGQVTALDGADFELRPGEILAVIGDNGAGKSSLIKCLSGASIPNEGQIWLDGKEIH